MKQFIRIMGLALVFTLLCATAFAAPSNLSQVEGLPERPEVPTMTTKNDGTIQTVTLSGPLASLSAVAGLEFFPMEFSEDGLTATLDMATLNGQIIGRANTGYYVNGSSSSYQTRMSQSFRDDEVEDVDETIATIKEAMTEDAPLGKEQIYGIYNNGQAQSNDYDGPEYFSVDTYENEDAGYTRYTVAVRRDYHNFVYQASPINGYALAYEGTTADGAIVRYDNYGKLKEIIVTVEGQNYLGSEQAPTKSEVHFEQVTAGDSKVGQTTYWVIRSIKEYYTDENGEETFEHVKFAYNGSYDGHVRTDDIYAPNTYENGGFWRYYNWGDDDLV